MDETLTKEDPDLRYGIAARVTLKTPRRLTLTNLSQYSSVVSSSGMDVGFTPAQLKTWWMAPNLECVSLMNFVTSWLEETSTSSMCGRGVFVEHDFTVSDRLS